MNQPETASFACLKLVGQSAPSINTKADVAIGRNRPRTGSTEDCTLCTANTAPIRNSYEQSSQKEAYCETSLPFDNCMYIMYAAEMQYSQLQLHHSVCIRVLYNYEDVVLVRCYHYFVLLAAQAQKGERICLIQSSHDAICLHISNMETVDSQFTRMALARRARYVTNRQVALNQNGKQC
eukprot:9379-Heterococcus_DN1.PRE.2